MTGENSQTESTRVQPASSKIRLEHLADGGLTANIPAAGLLRGSKGLFVMAILWNGISWLIATVIICSGEGELFAVAIIGLFLVVGVALLIAAVNMGTRRAGIAIAGDCVQVLRKGILGSKTYSFDIATLKSIRIGNSGMSVNDRPVVELQFVTEEDDSTGMLAGRDDAELLWLADELNHALTRLRGDA